MVDPVVVGFPVSTEERTRRLRVEVERLACLPPFEWMLYLDDTAKKHDLEPAKLKAMVEATIKAAEKKRREEKAEDRRREGRAEKKRDTAKRDEERKRERLDRQARREAEKKEREK
jgi:hypothetical protein